MTYEKFVNIRDWVEPAHPGILKVREDLVSIYKHIKDGYQKTIDETFDKISRDIGFIVVSALAAEIETAAGGVIIDGRLADEMRGTIFDRGMAPIFKKMKSAKISGVSPQVYKIYVFWHEALKLKLSAAALDPQAAVHPKLKKFPQEPVHWFDAGTLLPIEEVMSIMAIDQVYPDLQLMNRVDVVRQASRKPMRWEVMEPAHLRRFLGGEAEDALQQIREIIGR